MEESSPEHRGLIREMKGGEGWNLRPQGEGPVLGGGAWGDEGMRMRPS